METTQLAVDWLIKKYADYGTLYYEDITKAKAMEKEQIIDAYWNGTTDMEKSDALIDAEKFYNEYYGKKN